MSLVTYQGASTMILTYLFWSLCNISIFELFYVGGCGPQLDVTSPDGFKDCLVQQQFIFDRQLRFVVELISIELVFMTISNLRLLFEDRDAWYLNIHSLWREMLIKASYLMDLFVSKQRNRISLIEHGTAWNASAYPEYERDLHWGVIHSRMFDGIIVTRLEIITGCECWVGKWRKRGKEIWQLVWIRDAIEAI